MILSLQKRKWPENRKVIEKIYVFQNESHGFLLTIGTQIIIIDHDVLL
jgi:hypothetical protein